MSVYSFGSETRLNFIYVALCTRHNEIQKCVRGKQNKTKGDKHNRGKGGSAVMVKKKQIKQLTGLFLCVCFIRISFESCEKITAIIDQHKEKSR